MKTDKFEKTIRQKLESISPDFQEDDWAKMHNYMHAHTPPRFWQQYGSWLGYAAAASVSTVMAFLYIGQLSQTNDLASDVKNLQNQIEISKNTSALIPRTDTIYIVQKEVTKDQFFEQQHEQTYTVSTSRSTNYHEATQDKNRISSKQNRAVGNELNNQIYLSGNTKEIVTPGVAEADMKSFSETTTSENNPPIATDNFVTSSESEYTNIRKSLGNDFDHLSELESVQIPNNSRKMHYELASRFSGRQLNKVLLANAAIEDKKIEKNTKTKNTIPRLNLKVPSRFGGGVQFEGGNQIKTVLGEALVSKKFSVSTGFSWVKIKQMEFFTEKIFREKNSKDLKKSYPNEVPKGVEVLNISVKPSLVQIPLTVAFRNEMKNDFSYYASAGTNITVKGKEQFAFDCRLPMPGQEFRNNSFERKMDIPLVNSLNLSVGIEKTWHPIVIQVEGYLYQYFRPISSESSKTGPGAKLKLLYQIGRKM